MLLSTISTNVGKVCAWARGLAQEAALLMTQESGANKLATEMDKAKTPVSAKDISAAAGFNRLNDNVYGPDDLRTKLADGLHKVSSSTYLSLLLSVISDADALESTHTALQDQVKRTATTSTAAPRKQQFVNTPGEALDVMAQFLADETD